MKEDFSSRNQQFGKLLRAECRRMHIQRDQVLRVAGISSNLLTAVRHG